jgi:hypothetical protein
MHAIGEVSLADVLGLTGPDEVLISAGTTTLHPSATIHLVLVAASGTVKNRLNLHSGPSTIGRRGARMTLHDAARVFTAHLKLERTEQGETTLTELTTDNIVGGYPYEVRAAMEMFRTAEPTDRLQLRLNDRSIGDLIDLAPAQIGQILGGLWHDDMLIAALEEVQAHTGQPFPIPELTPAESSDLLASARLLAGETVRLKPTPITVPIAAHEIECLLQAQQDGSILDLRLADAPYAITCGAHRLDLDRVAVHMPQAVLTNSDELRAAAESGRDGTAHFAAATETGVYLRVMPAAAVNST